MVSMREEAELEYGKMKAFLAFYVERYFLNLETLPPEKWPIASLEALEKGQEYGPQGAASGNQRLRGKVVSF